MLLYKTPSYKGLGLTGWSRIRLHH